MIPSPETPRDDQARRPTEPTPAAEPGEATQSLRTASDTHGSHRTADVLGPGSVLGDYEIVCEIARGGMGIVYQARQRGVKRTVALKVTLAGQFADERERRRFAQEVEAAGKLNHPHIVPIYEVGEHGGLPYFSMAFVEGTSLQRLLQQGPLPARRAAEVVQLVARAVHYAHQQGIVHRDLKPSNVLIAADGQPRVTDFGLAKQVSGEQSLTATGEVLGTPAYMPPEQALGMTNWVNARSDVYSLGATLYEALTGRRPFSGESVVEVLRRVIDEEPAAPRSVRAEVPRDLETICLKCLSKESRLRYATAEDLAADLERYLQGHPILARPVSRLERTVRWCRRNPLVATLSVSTVTLLLAAGMVLGVSWWRERSLQSQAVVQSKRVRQIEQQVAEQDRQLDEQRGRASAASQEAAEKGREVDRERKARESAARLAEANRLAAVARKEADENIVVGTLLAAEAVSLSRAAGEKPTPAASEVLMETLARIGGYPLRGHTGSVTSLALHPAGRWLASGGADTTVRLWDLHAERPENNSRELRHPQGNPVADLAFNAAGEWLAVAHGNDVGLWNTQDLAQPVLRRTLRHNASVRRLVWTRDGRWLITWSGTQDILLWQTSEIAEGKPTVSRLLQQAQMTGFAVSADSRWLAVGTREAVQLFDLRGTDPTQVVRTLDCERKGPATMLALQFSGDGRRLVAGGQDGIVRIWELASDQTAPKRRLATGVQGIEGVAANFTGQEVVAASADRTVRIWKTENSDPQGTVRVYRGLEGNVTQLSISSRYNMLVIATQMGTIGFNQGTTLQISDDPLTVLAGHEDAITSAIWNGSQSTILTSSRDGTIRVWEMGAGQVTSSVVSGMVIDGRPLERLEFSRQGLYLAAGTSNATVHVRDLSVIPPNNIVIPTTKANRPPFAFHRQGELVYLDVQAREVRVVAPGREGGGAVLMIPGEGTITAFRVSPAGGVILVGFDQGGVLLWRRGAAGWPTVPEEHVGHTQRTQLIQVSNDERWAVTYGSDTTLRLWSLPAMECAWSVPVMGLANVQISHRNEVVWGVTHDGQLVSWARNSGTRKAYSEPTGGQPPNCLFSDDVRWLVVSAPFRPVVLWNLSDPENPQSIALGKPRGAETGRLAFSRDGAWLATSDEENGIHLWDLTDAQPASTRRRLRGHLDEVTCADFSADGQWLATGSRDLTVRLWQLDGKRLLQSVTNHCGRVLTAEERQRFGVSGTPAAVGLRDVSRISSERNREGFLRAILRVNGGSAMVQTSAGTEKVESRSQVTQPFQLLSVVAGESSQQFTMLDFLLHCRELRELGLAGRPVTDGDIGILSQFTLLRRLDIRGTKVTPQGQQLLRDLFPQCEVICGELPARLPQLLEPLPEAVLANGQRDLQLEHRWTFRWTPVEWATNYHVYVIGATARIPVIDQQTSATHLTRTSRSYVPENGLRDWRWKVRAFVNGQWGPWSEERRFHVAPQAAP